VLKGFALKLLKRVLSPLANFQTASGEFLISCLLLIVTQSLAGEGYLPAPLSVGTGAGRQGVRGRMKELVFRREREYNFFNIRWGRRI
jgi:hypothetical protein